MTAVSRDEADLLMQVREMPTPKVRRLFWAVIESRGWSKASEAWVLQLMRRNGMRLTQTGRELFR